MTENGTEISNAQKLAKSSWQIFILAILLNSINRIINVFALEVAIELLIFVFLAGGIVIGIVALFEIKRYGKEKILWPALTGIILNGLLIVIGISNVLRAAFSTQ